MIPDAFWTRIKKVQRIHQRLYDSGKGWIVGWLILLLRHTGRKSGKAYATPLQYEKISGAYHIGAARGANADWFRNIQANPHVVVSVGRKTFSALAEPVTDPEKVADFLAYRLKHHPLMIGLMMKMHKMPMKPNREQLLEMGRTTAVVILHLSNLQTKSVNPMIEAKNLSKSFGSVDAVQDLSLNVNAGEIYGLVGSDGAGKTTTLRLIVGALKADAGAISICGQDVRRQGEQARACLGYLSQRFSLYEDLTVLENIRFFAELRGLTRDEWLPRCMEILDFVGLASFKDRRAGQLSGGMKQKLGLASALVTRPRVLLLDEPTTGVDPVTRQDFWQLILKLASTRLTDSAPVFGEDEGSRRAVLLTTPYMDEASRCHRVGFMRGGKIIAEGTPSELRATLEGRILEVRGPALNALRKTAGSINGVEDVRAFGDKLHLRIQPGQAEAVSAALAEAVPAQANSNIEAHLVAATLEDVFLSLSR